MSRFPHFALLLTASLIASSAAADTISLTNVQVGAPGQTNSVRKHYFSVGSADSVSILVDAPSWGDPNYIQTQFYLFTSSGALVGSALGGLNGNASLIAALTAGTYVIAVGDYPLTAQEAWAGVNQPDLWEQLGIGANDGSYNATISSRSAKLAWVAAPGSTGTGGTGGGAGTGVPELSMEGGSGALLLLLGGVALTTGRRRRIVAA